MNERFEKDLIDIEIPENIEWYTNKGIELAKEELNKKQNIVKRFIGFLTTNKKQSLIIAATCFLFIIGNVLSIGALMKNLNSNIVYNNLFVQKKPIIKALNEDENGVNVNSRFLISDTAYKTADEVAQNLVVTPNENYIIEKKFEGFILSFDKPMQMNKIYNFVFTKGEDDKESYAFQTKQEFMVSGVFPRDGAANVPVVSGIEVTFSLSGIKDYEQYFEISPKVEGRFDVKGSMLVFYPTNKYDLLTKYTVIIKKGLKTTAGDELKEDYMFSFSTESGGQINKQNDYISISGNNVENFLAEDTPVVEIVASDSFKDVEFSCEVLEIKDYKEYGKLIKQAKDIMYFGNGGSSTNFESKNAKKVFDFKSKLVISGEKYIVLPKNLAEGYYIVNISGKLNDKEVYLQKFIQINNLALYAQTDKNSVLLWLNSIETKKPLKDAQITLGGNDVGKTAEDGTIKFNFEGARRNEIIVITPDGGKPYVDIIDLYPSNQKKPYEKYYTYIYTDKSVYLSNETLRVFGFIKSRDGTPIAPDLKLDVNTDSYYYNYFEDDYYRNYSSENSLISKSIDIQPSGAFIADIKLEDFKSGYYYIDVISSDEILASNSFEIYNYVKPLYQIKYDENNKYLLFADEKTPFKANVSFYDGTPAKGLKFAVGDAEVFTDESGYLSREVVFANENNSSSWRPDTASLSLECLNAEDKTISRYVGYTILPRTVMLTGEKFDDNSILFKTNKIIKDKAENEKINYWIADDILRGEPVNIPIKIILYKTTYTPVKVETYYDYINKTSVDRYDYTQPRTEIVSEQTVNTVNGEYLLQNIQKNDQRDVYYHYEAECKDTKGRFIKEKIYTYTNEYFRTDGYKNYNFAIGMGSEDNYSRIECADNETKRINLFEDADGQVKSGVMMYSIMKEGILEYHYAENPFFDFSIKNEFIPNCFISGSFFDGKRIYPINQRGITYNYKEKELTVNVTPDKRAYEPGETVNLKINVTDLKNNPRIAAVNLSVVDEAVFAVAPQYVELLEQLYYPYYFRSGLKSELVSYRQHLFTAGQGAEQGDGDGGMNIRDNFVDNAQFVLVNTDANGNAEVSFKLPDNLTSWRITTQAITDDIYGGKNITNITCGLPFFADMILNERVLAGDDISINTRAFGTALNTGENVAFTARIIYENGFVVSNEDGESMVKSATLKAGDILCFNFGKLPEGKYKARLEASAKGYSDALEKPFEVVLNTTELNLTSTFDLKEGIDIDALKSPLELMVYNKDSVLTNGTLFNLYFSNNKRNDQKLAKIVAGNMLKELADEEDKQFYSIDGYSEGDYQIDNGGAAIYPYAEADPLLTAKMIMTQPECINQARAIEYFNSIVNKKDETDKIKIASAYLGLAAYRQPVLNKIKTMYAATKNEDYKLRLILACAFTAIGDDITANEIFNAAFYDKVISYGDNTARISIGIDNKPNEEITALSLLVLSKTNKELGQKILKHMVYHSDEYIFNFYGLEELIFVKNTLRAKGTQAVVEYTADSERKQFELYNAQVKRFTMTKDQLSLADFKVLSGEAEVTVNFVGNSGNIDPATASLKVTKSIELLDKNDSIINVGDNLRITINVTNDVSNTNNFEFIDFIPSGMRFVKYDNSYPGYLIKNEGQKLTAAYYSKTGVRSAQIAYIVRAVTEGEYVSDNAFVVGNKYNEWGFSDRSSVKIEK